LRRYQGFILEEVEGKGRSGKLVLGEDLLELLIQLERWGLIEKRLNIEDDEE